MNENDYDFMFLIVHHSFHETLASVLVRSPSHDSTHSLTHEFANSRSPCC